ncbi:hypothetical protein D3C76_1844250 [compost metagenome]
MNTREPYIFRNLRQILTSLNDSQFGLFDTNMLQVIMKGDPQLCLEYVRQMIGSHTHMPTDGFIT